MLVPCTKCQDNTFKDAFMYGMYVYQDDSSNISKTQQVLQHILERCFLTYLNWSRPLMFSCFKLRMIGPRSLIDSTKMAII